MEEIAELDRYILAQILLTKLKEAEGDPDREELLKH